MVNNKTMGEQDLGVLNEISDCLGNLPTGLFEFILGFTSVISFLSLAFILICYLLRTLALHRMAKDLGFRCPWLAFIPVGEDYVMGRITDISAAKGSAQSGKAGAQNAGDKKSSFWRATLTAVSASKLVLSVIRSILAVTIVASLVSTLAGGIDAYGTYNSLKGFFLGLISLPTYSAEAISELISSQLGNSESIQEALQTVVKAFAGIAGYLAIAMVVTGLIGLLGLAFRILYTVACYRVFEAYGLGEPLLWSIVAFIFPLAAYICLFVIRKRSDRVLSAV